MRKNPIRAEIFARASCAEPSALGTLLASCPAILEGGRMCMSAPSAGQLKCREKEIWKSLMELETSRGKGEIRYAEYLDREMDLIQELGAIHAALQIGPWRN